MFRNRFDFVLSYIAANNAGCCVKTSEDLIDISAGKNSASNAYVLVLMKSHSVLQLKTFGGFFHQCISHHDGKWKMFLITFIAVCLHQEQEEERRNHRTCTCTQLILVPYELLLKWCKHYKLNAYMKKQNPPHHCLINVWNLSGSDKKVS